MKKLFILAVATGFIGATMMTTQAMARRGGSLKTTAKHHEFAGAAKPPAAAKGSGKTRVRAAKIRLIKVHGSAVGFILK